MDGGPGTQGIDLRLEDVEVHVERGVGTFVHQSTGQVPVAQATLAALKVGTRHDADIATDTGAGIGLRTEQCKSKQSAHLSSKMTMLNGLAV